MENYLQPPVFNPISTKRANRRLRPFGQGLLGTAITTVLTVILFTFLAAAQDAPTGQTALTIAPGFCGSTKDVRCVFVPIADGGSLWIQWLPNRGVYKGFIQFTGDGSDDLAGTTSAMSASYSLGQYQGITPSAAHPTVSIEYVLTINSFSGTDVNGDPFSGSGTLNFHYVFTRGSGRGGGGAGWHMVEDGGTITVNQ